jgi:pimeloyl-ACP methyl ester carboxylesterase
MNPLSAKDMSSPGTALCVHGAGAGGWEWKIWARVLAARGWQVRAPDLEPAPAGLASTRFEDYRSQVIAWSRDEQGGCGHLQVLIGASLGGLLAVSVAREVNAAALVLLNPMPPAGIVSRPLGEPHAAIRRWGAQRSIAATRRAMPDADDAACLYAFRRWRDESGLALEAARLGVVVDYPRCPVLVMASELDKDVPMVVSRELATRCSGDFRRLPGCSHVGPLLGYGAASTAEQAADWLLAQTARPKQDSSG